MRPLPLPSQFPIFKDRVWALGVWSLGLRQYHISDVVNKMVELLKRERKEKGKEAGDFIFRQLNRDRREIDMALSHGSPYDHIAKKWLRGLLNLHVGQPKG